MAGHVEKRAAGRWVAVWKDPVGKRRGKSFTRKVDAERHLAVTTTAMLKHEWIDPDAGQTTMREYAELWVVTRPVRETTRARQAGELRYLGAIADIPLNRLTASIMEAWQAELLSRLARSTVATVRATVAAILSSAVRDRLIAVSPLATVDKARPDTKRVTPMTRATVQQIYDDITPWYRAAVLVGAGCGLRRGEAFGLCVDRVDFLRRRVTIDQALYRLKGRGVLLGPPKNGSSVRVVPLPGFVGGALARHMARYGAGPDGLVFRTRGGLPVDAGVLADAWRRVAPAGSRFHDLRHFYASTLIESGASVKEVQARLGHATAKETLDTYAHLWPDSEDVTRARLDAAWSALDVAPKNIDHG